MKIIDSNNVHQKSIEADVCIIGAGPAGITLASKLAGSGVNVIIAESGGIERDKKLNHLNSLSIDSNFRYRHGTSERNRQIGGTANLWAGRVVPFRFDPVLDEEWGALKDAVFPYYGATFRIFGIDPDIQHEQQDSECELVAYWADKTERFNIGSELLKKNKNGCIYHHLTCIGEPEYSGDKINRLTFINGKREKLYVNSSCFVFAMGAIENSRMLLVIHEQLQKKNRTHRNTGKYIMDHPRIWHGKVISLSKTSEISQYQIKRNDHGLYKTGIRNSPESTRVYCNLMKKTNRFNVLLNRIPSESFRVSFRKLLMREKGMAKTIANESLRLPVVRHSKNFRKFLMRTFNHDSQRIFHVMTYCEQRPRDENNIVLKDKLDRNGLPIPLLKNNLHKSELNEVVGFFAALDDWLGTVDCRWEYDLQYILNPENYTDASHVIGGTRYSVNQEKAVVQKDLSVIGIPNLYMAGSSVFPTSGVENPTHLIVSLSCYLADVLKKKFE